MKKFLLGSISALALSAGGAAMAADLPVKAPPPPVVAPIAWSWTGFYLGYHTGAAWGTKEFTPNCPVECFPHDSNEFSLNSFAVNGWVAGGQVGYRWQWDRWVIGVEGTLSAADVKGHTDCGSESNEFAGVTCSSKSNWFATAAVQSGWAVDHALIYTKFGAAWTHDRYSMSNNPRRSDCDGFCTGEQTRVGWLWGAGVAYAFLPNWSAFVEYDYMNFGTKSVDVTCDVECFHTFGLHSFTMDVDQKIHMVKAGINWRFDWGKGKAPIAARY